MKKHILWFASMVFAVSALCAVGLTGCADDPTEPLAPQAEALAAPRITLTDNTVEWDAVEYAVSYSVYVGEDEAVSVTTTSYTVNKTEPAAYEIYVVANPSSNGNYTKSEKSNTVVYEVFSPEEVVLVKLRLVNNPDKTDYFLDETCGGGELDLTGLAVNAAYSNGSVKKVTPVLEQVDLSTAGDKTVKLSYTENGRTASTSFVVTVRRRTENDISDIVTLKHEFTGAGKYKIADGTVTAVDMDGNEVAVTTAGGESSIQFDKSGVKLVKVTSGGEVSFVKVCAAYYVTNAAQFLAMNDNLDGYYLLRNNITFEGYNATIGVAPVRAANAGEFADERAYTFDKNGSAQTGKAFVGTFDGDGYVITGYRHACDEGVYSAPSSYYLGMFGYIGEGGKVCNFVLRNAGITGGKCCAVIAGVNLGTIENVTVEDDCSLSVFYNGGAVGAAYNGGSISNVVCIPARFESNYGGGAFVSAYESSDGAQSRNVYINNKTNLTSVLGNGWYYAKGIGTVYCNESYKKVLDIDTTMYKGQTGKIVVFQRTVGDLDFTAWVGGTVTEGILEYSSYGQETYTYYVLLRKSASVGTGDSFSVAVKYGQDYLNNAVQVTVGAPYVVSASYEGEPIQVIAGTDLNLQSIQLKTVYTDGSEGTMNPVSCEGYNKAGVIGVAQNVKLFFGTGANDYVTVSVTPKQAEGKVVTGISAQLKNSSVRIVTDMNGTPDFDLYFTFTITYSEGAPETVTVAADGVTVTNWSYGHNAAALVSYPAGGVSDTVEMDVWAVVKTVADFAAIQNNLSGYYMLEEGTDPFDFAHAAPRIGAVPTKVVGEDTVVNTADTAEATAFTGKFDGNGRTLLNWGDTVDGYEGWSGGANFAYAMFSYIGASGEVTNFTVDNCLVQGFNNLGIVCCFNKGTIKNVTVNANCNIDTVWYDLGVFAAINNGAVVGCVNNGATYTSTKQSGAKTEAASVGTGNAPVSGTQTQENKRKD